MSSNPPGAPVPIPPTAPSPTPKPPTPTSVVSIGEKLLKELPALLMFAEQAAGVPAALGPAPHTAAKWASVLGFMSGSIVANGAAAYDQIHGGAHVTVDQVATVLGVDPRGVIGQAIAIGEALAS